MKIRLASDGAEEPSSGAALRQLVEQTLRDGLPDAAHVEVLDSTPSPPEDFVPLASVQRLHRPHLIWQTVLHLDEMLDGGLRSVETEREPVLVAELGNEFYAYRPACPGTPLPLHGGRVEGATLHCPWHRCRFDLRDGKRVDTHGFDLATVPIVVEGEKVRIGILAGAAG